MLFRQLFDAESCTYTYLMADLDVREAILVDPVKKQVARDFKLLTELDLSLRYCLETHVHGDHITGATQLRAATGCLVIVPNHALVSFAERHIDRYIDHGEVVTLGDITVEALATPGHTNSHMAYLVNGDGDSFDWPARVLSGDALLIRGCGRTDLQSGDAGKLYDSVTQQLFTLPDYTEVYPGHDYRGHSVSTISEEKQWNPRFAGRSRSEFIEFMQQLDLPDPKKTMEAAPVNQQGVNQQNGRSIVTV
jgi:sulfur dioxygenase